MNTPRRKPGASRAEDRAPPSGSGAMPIRSASLRLDHVRRRRRPRAGPAAGRLLPVERRLRVLHPADPRPASASTARQRGGAQDQGVRLDRRRPGGAVLLRGAQQGLAVHPLPRPAARREGGLRRLHAAPLGAHVRGLEDRRDPAARPAPRPAGRAEARPAAQRRGARRRPGWLQPGADSRPGTAPARPALRAADQHLARRPAPTTCARRSSPPSTSRPGGRPRSCSSRTGPCPTSSPPRSGTWSRTARSRSRHVEMADERRPRPGPRRRAAGQRARDRRADGRRRRQRPRPVREAAPADRGRRRHRRVGPVGVRRVRRGRRRPSYAARPTPTRSGASSASATRSTTRPWSTAAAPCWPPAATPTWR